MNGQLFGFPLVSKDLESVEPELYKNHVQLIENYDASEHGGMSIGTYWREELMVGDLVFAADRPLPQYSDNSVSVSSAGHICTAVLYIPPEIYVSIFMHLSGFCVTLVFLVAAFWNTRVHTCTVRWLAASTKLSSLQTKGSSLFEQSFTSR